MTTEKTLSSSIERPDITSLIDDAIANGIIAAEPIVVGDHGLLVRRPGDWVAEIIDTRRTQDHPLEASGAFRFAAVESLIRYVNRFRTRATLGYINDVTAKGQSALTADHQAVSYVLDDLLAADEAGHVPNRNHTAALVLRPTTAARRWGAVFGKPLTQVQMVELVIDGTGEIASPDSADLRDLISDLHAIRTTSAKSIVRTGGGLAVELADNVALHAGTGSLVTVPESMTLVLQPWTAVPGTITVDVKIRPVVNSETVAFVLSAPHLEEALNAVLLIIHADLTTGTNIEPFWTP